MLIIDDTGFVKKGTTSAGAGRQYTGTSGKIDNCQIGVFAAYATGRGRVLVDRELYLPKAWTPDRDRCRAAKIPDERGFATKGELARDIVRRCTEAGLPATWVTADEAYGQDWNFRRLLEQLGLGYVVAVPKVAAEQVPGRPAIPPGNRGNEPTSTVPLTVAEIRRLLDALLPHPHPELDRHRHALTWSWWRRRHQATARRCHYRRRTSSGHES